MPRWLVLVDNKVGRHLWAARSCTAPSRGATTSSCNTVLNNKESAAVLAANEMWVRTSHTGFRRRDEIIRQINKTAFPDVVWWQAACHAPDVWWNFCPVEVAQRPKASVHIAVTALICTEECQHNRSPCGRPRWYPRFLLDVIRYDLPTLASLN